MVIVFIVCKLRLVILLHEQLRVEFVPIIPIGLGVVVRRFGLIDFHMSVVLVGRMEGLHHVQLIELGTFAKTI